MPFDRKKYKQFMQQNNQISMHRISIAPMLDITYEHFRVFFRQLTRFSTLYTEMINMNAALHNQYPTYLFTSKRKELFFNPVEHPIVCQLGGNDPGKLAQAAKQCEAFGYDEINLNVGCPSERVQDGSFGACLMKTPELVANIVRAMKEAVDIPVTVKCRLGVDDLDSYEFSKQFVKTVSEDGGIEHFIIHARKAYLKGLNPVENRNVPPLRYDYVLQLKKDFPDLKFSINGGFKTADQIIDILSPEKGLEGCMLGRAAYDNPWIFSDFDRKFYNQPNQNFSRKEILREYGQFVDKRKSEGCNISYQQCVKPLIGLFHGEKQNAIYRQYLSVPANFKKFETFSEFIEAGIQQYELVNPSAMNARPNDHFKALEPKNDQQLELQ